jgi:hypothetical protein
VWLLPHCENKKPRNVFEYSCSRMGLLWNIYDRDAIVERREKEQKYESKGYLMAFLGRAQRH